MQRLEYDHYGGPDVVHIASFTLPKPTAEEIVVRVAAASVNPMDWKLRSGEMKMVTGWRFPRGLGSDFAGIVETVGSSVSRFKPGDAVVGTVSMKASGAFASRLVTSQRLVVHKPDNLSFTQAACLPIAGVTAWLVLVKHASLRRGQKLLINGALGAVGQAAMAIADYVGAEVAGRVGPNALTQAKASGLDPALDYTQPLSAALDGAFDVVFDCHGSMSAKDARRLLKPGGLVLDIVPTPAKFLRALVSRSHKVVIADTTAENLQPVVDLAAAGKLMIPIVQTSSLEQAPPLLAALERGERLNGKTVIVF